jgi:putative oxidoreductase
MTLPRPFNDIAVLVARVLLGVVLVAHGLQKLLTDGIGATGAAFGSMGVPLPSVSAFYAMVAELGGGLLLLVGLVTTVAAGLVALDMLGALVIVHVRNGVFVDQGGWELVGLIAVVALLVAAVGGGRYSLDGLLSARRHSTTAASSS